MFIVKLVLVIVNLNLFVSIISECWTQITLLSVVHLSCYSDL